MRASVLDVQHKKPLTAGRPRFFGKLSHASRGVPCPRVKYGNYRRSEIRRPGPAVTGLSRLTVWLKNDGYQW